MVTHIIPLLQKGTKDEIPNVKIALCRLIPDLIKNHSDGSSIGSNLRREVGDLTSDPDPDVKYFAGVAVAALG